MARFPEFILYMQLDPPTSKPFRLLEVFECANGIRTRIVDGQFELLEAAQCHRLALEETARKRKEGNV